ncbi:hypothetical protein [Lutibaculum baratangense]|uniref:DUF2267 domain-containing protein n=1 Tax=Lutibaculum baratangense AMV1 TaxID=631454 RepID=V4T811_9HYPH|nr:hypothetical protein [Lutibaculum baratangense]ESR22738.1 uncharacterized protein N177_3875 [Lutibaculum baratangense AMV1]
MDELVGRVMQAAEVDAGTARRVIEIELAFIKDHGPDEKVGELLRRIPGGEAIETPEAGSFGGMMGAMSAYAKLQGLGLGTSQLRSATKEILTFAREHGGDDDVDDIVRAIPLLSQVM